MSDPEQTNHGLNDARNERIDDDDDIPVGDTDNNDVGVSTNTATTNVDVIISRDDINTIPRIPPVSTLPDGRIIDGKNTLHSLDDTLPSTRDVVGDSTSTAAVMATNRTTSASSTIDGSVHRTTPQLPPPPPPVLTIPDGRIIDAKNTLQSFDTLTTARVVVVVDSTTAPLPENLTTPSTQPDGGNTTTTPNLTLPDGRVIDGKNTLQSFDALQTSTRNVAVAAATTPIHPMLPDGRIIDGKNTLQLFNAPRSTPIAAMASTKPTIVSVATDAAVVVGRPIAAPPPLIQRFDPDGDTSYLITTGPSNHVVANGIDDGVHTTTTASVDAIEVHARHRADNRYTMNSNNSNRVVNHDTNGRTTEDTLHAEAVVVESFAVADIVESRRGMKFWLTIAFAVIVGSVVTGIGVVCGTGQCRSTSSTIDTNSSMGAPVVTNTNTPSVSPIDPLMIACNFLSLTNVTECQEATDFSGNTVGETIPSEIGLLTQLESLYLNVKGLRGTVPSTVGNLLRLRVLDLSENQLSGAIPSTLGNLTLLAVLYMQINLLNGTIPSILGSLSDMNYLDLSINQLSGSIPSTLGNLDALNYLYLSSNQLTGTIPSTLPLTIILYLKLGYNQLTGTIPSTFGKVDTSYIIEFELENNYLNGTIPSTLGNLVELQTIMLYGNQLTGTIPSTLGNLLQLSILYLHGNQLNGTLPSTFGNLTQLNVFDLSNNAQLAGTVPSSLCAVARIDIQADCDFVSCSCCCCSLPGGGCSGGGGLFL